MINFEKKIALITGSGRGIGRSIALELGKRGIFVYINYRSDIQSAQETVNRMSAHKGEGQLLPFDVADSAACETAVKSIIKATGRIDILVNNAGIRDDRLFALMKKPSWRNVLDTNLNSFYNVTKPVIKNMLKNRYGRIVTITSASGQMGNAGQVNYAAAKAGLIGATKALAREVGSRNITVNAVAPGFIKTEMMQGIDEEKIMGHIPAGRLGTPCDVANAIAFLTSDKAAYINGQVLGVNGGMV